MANVPIKFYGQLFTGDEITPSIARAANIAKTYGLALIAARTPVDTGLLRSNWKAKLEGNGIRWLNDTSYASFVELGTKKMAPRHMLTDSLLDISEVFESELLKDMGRKAGAKLIAEKVATPSQPTYINRTSDKQPGNFNGKPKYSKTYLFPNRADILSPAQRDTIATAKPKYKKRTK
jgi:hypothetical protein